MTHREQLSKVIWGVFVVLLSLVGLCGAVGIAVGVGVFIYHAIAGGC